MTLSSRKFLNLIRRLTDKSEFKTHAAPPFGRDGDWTLAEKMLAATHEEVAKYVASQLQTEWAKFLSPLEQIAAAEESAEDQQTAVELIDSLFE